MEFNYVIDTNIIMGFLISGKSSYKPLIRAYNFFLPEFGLVEIAKYEDIIFEKTKLEKKQLIDFSYFLFSEISIFPNYILDKDIVKEATELTKNVDIKDSAFTALSMLTLPLLTRDDKLVKGLKKRKYKNIILFKDFLQDLHL